MRLGAPILLFTLYHHHLRSSVSMEVGALSSIVLETANDA